MIESTFLVHFISQLSSDEATESTDLDAKSDGDFRVSTGDFWQDDSTSRTSQLVVDEAMLHRVECLRR